MHRFTRIPGALVAIAVLALGASACGDDDNPVDPGPDPGSNVVVLDGAITANRTLSPDSVYVVRGFLEVRPGVTLTIPAGMEVFSDPVGSGGTIVTLPGIGGDPSGRLVVQGTQANPVIFLPGTVEDAENATNLSPSQVSSCARGSGGGIILLGDAPVNQSNAISEGVNRGFGGDDPADDSGDIQFLVILCGGREIAPDNEINGLTLSGVGTGTRISHVQAHLIADDGFEWFGGTVHADHLISSGNDDDAFDCDWGWTGTVQFGLAIQDRELSNRGSECDNDANGSAFEPLTNPSFWNMTYIGAGVEQANSEINDGPFLRRNGEPDIRNAIIANFGNVGVVIDGTGAQAHATAGDLVLDHILFFGNQALASDAAQGATECVEQNVNFRGGVSSDYHLDGVATAFDGNTFVCADPQFMSVNFADPINGTKPDPRPAPGSPALVPANADTPSGPGIVDTGADYLGAFSGTDWTATWSVWVSPTP